MDDDLATKSERRIRISQTVRLLGLFGAVAALVALAFANQDDVEVDWLVGSTDGPLVVVIAVSAALGVLLGALLSWRHNR